MKRIAFMTATALIVFAGVAFAAGSITGQSIKDGTLTGKDVKNKSLTKADFKGSVRGPRGAAGPAGAAGAAGAAGPPGPPGPTAVSAITPIFGTMTIEGGDIDGGTVSCPEGERAISGGFFNDGIESEIFLSEATEDRTGWIVALDNEDSTEAATLEGVAYCAGADRAVAARRTTRSLRPLTGRALRRVQARRAAAR